MTDDIPPHLTLDEEDGVLAAEYTLGLLTPVEADAFEQRLSVDPRFREIYARWARQFTSLMDSAAPVAPPARVLTAINAELFPAARTPSLWARLGLFPALAGALVAVIVVLGLVNLDVLTGGPDTPAYVASIVAEDQSLVILASYVDGTLQLERTVGAVAAGRSQELWLIVPDVEAPISLGVLSDTAVTTITPTDDIAAALAGGTLAISDEPPGGSPTGAATGAVLAIGAVTDA